MEPIEERKGGGGKAQRPDAAPRTATEDVAGRFHRHGHGILVPIAERTLALGLALKRWIEPAVRICNRLALQAPPGDVGAERENALGHQSSLPLFLRCGLLNTIEAGGAILVCGRQSLLRQGSPPRSTGSRHEARGATTNKHAYCLTLPCYPEADCQRGRAGLLPSRPGRQQTRRSRLWSPPHR